MASQKKTGGRPSSITASAIWNHCGQPCTASESSRPTPTLRGAAPFGLYAPVPCFSEVTEEARRVMLRDGVGRGLAQSAAGLLRATGLHGHKYAMLRTTALAQPGRVTILTSDVEDTTLLSADHPRVTAEKVRSVSSWLPLPDPWGAQVVVQGVSGRCSVIQRAARSPEAAVRTAAAMTVALRPRVSARMPATRAPTA